MKSFLIFALFLFITIVLLGTAPSAHAGLILNNPVYIGLNSGLVGYWSFDGPDMAANVDTTTVLDRSGQGNDGQAMNMATSAMRVSGKIGQALEFDGVDDYVDMGDVSTLEPTPITVSAWIWERTTSGNQNIVSKVDTDTNRGWSLRQDLGTNLEWTLNDTSVVSTSFPSTQTWHHAVGIYDGDKSTLYLNGAEVGSLAGVADYTRATTNATIGVRNIGSPESKNYWNGIIDEVRIYNRALSADEIKRLYRIGATLKINVTLTDGLTEGLVGHWTFDGEDMNATQALDRSGQGNDGTLTNGPVRTKGKIGQALEFDGVNNYVDTTYTATYTTSDSFTWSLWMKAQRTAAQGLMGAITDQGAIDPAVHMTNPASNPSRFRVFVRDDAGNNDGFSTSAVNVTDGAWHHTVLVRDASVGQIRMYINGEERLSAADPTAANITLTGENVYIGAYNDRGSNDTPIDGLIDDVRIYNRALSADEVKRLYRIGATLKFNVTQKDTMTDGLVGHWTFDGPDMAGDLALDRSGQGNDGTLTPPAGGGPKRIKGKIGQALEFSGIDAIGDHVKIPANTTLEDLNTFTYSFWIYPTGWGEDNRASLFFRAGDTGTFRKQIRLLNEGGEQSIRTAVAYTPGPNPASNAANNSISLNEWQHVVITFDENGDKKLRIYKNSVELGYSTQTAGTGTPSDESPTYTSRIGGEHISDTSPFEGRIDEVRIYDRVLSPDEIKRLYIQGGGR